MKIALAGDWHGDRNAAREVPVLLKEFDDSIEYVFHLGDFGVWPGPWGREFLNIVQGAFRRAGMTLFVTPGNHEDYTQIAEIPITDDGVQWISSNVAILPRGFRWELGGRTFVSLGGAPSVDLMSRLEGRDWWREEMITIDEAHAVHMGGYADIMLAHDSPDGGTNAVQRIIDDPMGVQQWGHQGIAWAKKGRMAMNHAYAGVKPHFFAHGHFHVADMTVKDDGRIFLSVNESRSRYQLAVLDLETYEVEWVL